MPLEMNECPCGLDHHPSQCSFMDFGPADAIIGMEGGLSLHFGVPEYELTENQNDEFVVGELVIFNPGNGEAHTMTGCSEDLREFAKALSEFADRLDKKGRKLGRAVNRQRALRYFRKNDPVLAADYKAMMDKEKKEEKK